MRVDRNNPRQKYDGYWDWGWNYHPLWLLMGVWGYCYYLWTTDEVIIGK